MGGAGALRAEALREALPDFYARAVVDTELDPIASPRSTSPAARTAARSPSTPWSRCARSSPSPATTACRSPCPALDRERRGRAAPSSTACARTTPSSRWSSGPPSTATCDHRPPRQRRDGRRGGRRRRLPLRGGQRHRSSPSSTTSCTAPRPGPSSPSTRRTRTTRDENVAFRVLVKEVKVKQLPEATDEWAAESSEFATVAELRADIEDRIGRGQAHAEPDGAAPEDHRGGGRPGRRRGRARGPGRRRGQRAAPRPAAPAGGPEARPGRVLPGHRARRPTSCWPPCGWTPQAAVKADLALRALVEAEELTLSDEELDAEIARMAERMGTTPDGAAPPTRHGRPDRRGTLGAAQGQGAGVAARPRGTLRRRGQPDVTGRPPGRCVEGRRGRTTSDEADQSEESE